MVSSLFVRTLIFVSTRNRTQNLDFQMVFKRISFLSLSIQVQRAPIPTHPSENLSRRSKMSTAGLVGQCIFRATDHALLDHHPSQGAPGADNWYPGELPKARSEGRARIRSHSSVRFSKLGIQHSDQSFQLGTRSQLSTSCILHTFLIAMPMTGLASKTTTSLKVCLLGVRHILALTLK